MTVSLTTDTLYIAYEEAFLTRNAVDLIARKREIEKVKKDNADKSKEDVNALIREVKKRFMDEAKARRKEGKIMDRYMAIDLNPTCWGYSVLERIDDEADGHFRILFTESLDLSELCKKLGLKSDHPVQLKQNRKREHEWIFAMHYLIDKANHFRCGHFVMEDLQFGVETSMFYSTEARRKINNLWNRGLIDTKITSLCIENGIDFILVNPSYSSFIGNIKYRQFEDACSASIEIGRRGMFKYQEGKFYPSVTQDDLDTIRTVFGADALKDEGDAQ